MFEQIPFIILREIFRKIYKNDLFNFKILNKRIFNFITDDRVCQEIYLEKKYNLVFNDDLENIIKILDSKKYSKFFTQEKLLWKTEAFFIYIRPKDDSLINIYRGNPFRYDVFNLTSNINFCSDNFELIDNKSPLFEDKILNMGFLLINPIFYEEQKIINSIGKVNVTFKDKQCFYGLSGGIKCSINISFSTSEYNKLRFKAIEKVLLK